MPKIKAALKKATSAPNYCKGKAGDPQCLCDESSQWSTLDRQCLQLLDRNSGGLCGADLTPSAVSMNSSGSRTADADAMGNSLNSAAVQFHDQRVVPCTDFLYEVLPKCIDRVLKVVEVLDSCRSPQRAKAILGRLKGLKRYKKTYIKMCNRAANSSKAILQMTRDGNKTKRTGDRTR